MKKKLVLSLTLAMLFLGSFMVFSWKSEAKITIHSHFPQTYTCDRCDGRGWDPYDKCRECGGKGTINVCVKCQQCNGLGYYIDHYGKKAECFACNGRGERDTKLNCSNCSASGCARCRKCGGSGRVRQN